MSFAAVLLSLLGSELWLERASRAWLGERIETELLRHARATSALVDATPGRDVAALDPVADALGVATEARITIVAADGRVLGDSALPLPDVEAIDNHANRPEIVAARAGGSGASKRHSTTVGTDMLYVAVARPDGLVVRAAQSMQAVDRVVASMRALAGIALILGVALAAIGSGIAAEVMSRSLRGLLANARALVAGGAGRIPVQGADEIGDLAGSFNQLADALDQAVRALAAERDRLGAVLAGMSEGVVALDADRRVVLLNPAAQAMLGEAVVPGTALEALPEESPLREVLECGLDEGLASGEIDLGSPPRHVLARAACTATGCVVVMLDVTELRRLERVRRDFVANVSHELRTPVSVVLMNAETLIDGAVDDPKARGPMLDAVHRNAERLTGLIADLLDLAKIEAGRYPIAIEPCVVRDAVDRAVEAVRARADARRQRLDVDVDEVMEVQADDRALDHVLLNLVENAVKYTPDGGHVTVRARPLGPRVRLEIADDGPGVAPEHRERIFERFYRVDAGRSREVGGTGLGLSIVRHLADAMGGAVGVEPNVPHGSVFWVDLPAAVTATS